MQRYRSGHNGADSKSVCEQSHVGSNPTRCANSEIPTTVPFPPWGENCTLVGIFLPSGRTRCAGFRPDFEADIGFASSGYVGARSAPLHFQAAFFRGRLKIAFRSYAPFYQIEPAGPGLDLVGDAYLRKDGFGIFLQKADLMKRSAFVLPVLPRKSAMLDALVSLVGPVPVDQLEPVVQIGGLIELV